MTAVLLSRLLPAIVLGAASVGLAEAQEARVTSFKDVAPLFVRHCVSCHRPEGIAPFSLLSYRDARPRAGAVARAVRFRTMPPWKPDASYSPAFSDARGLAPGEIDRIERWVADGALEGEPIAAPTPDDDLGWRLGKPDLVVGFAEPYVVAAGGADLLRNFVVPVPLASGRYVKGIEFRPGNARVVHHANIRVDRSGTSRRADAADSAPGFDGRLTTGEFPDGHFLGWTPGQWPPLIPDGMAWRLEAGADLVVQLHVHPVDTAQVVQPSIGFYFTDVAPTRTPIMLRLGRQTIDLPAGQSRYQIEDRYVLPVDVEVWAVQPHAHYRARDVKGFAARPDGVTVGLIWIADWDFNWQDVYRYVQPVKLPKGTTIAMRYTYDNSSANRRNPDSPPVRVRWGQDSTDEMGDLWLQVLTATDADRRTLAADFGPKVMAEDAAGYETLLASEPGNARLHEAAAAIYLTLGRVDRAVSHLDDALGADPRSVEAHYNLGTALMWQRRSDAAIDEYRRALEIDPDHVGARVNLGAALRAQRRFDLAATALREALRRDPGNAAAHTNLAGTLAAMGETGAALLEYRAALAGSPDLVEPLTSLSWMLATSPDPAVRQPAEALWLAERAHALAPADDVRALDTLAAACAATGDFSRAAVVAESAARAATRLGLAKDAALISARVALYRRRTPYRDPALAPQK